MEIVEKKEKKEKVIVACIVLDIFKNFFTETTKSYTVIQKVSSVVSSIWLKD